MLCDGRKVKLLLLRILNNLHLNPKYWDSWPNIVIFQRLRDNLILLSVEMPKNAASMANIVDPDQTASRSSLVRVCAVCSPQELLSRYFKSLRLILLNLHSSTFMRYELSK